MMFFVFGLLFLLFLLLLRASHIDIYSRNFNEFNEKKIQKSITIEDQEQLLKWMEEQTWFDSYIKKFNPFKSLDSFFTGELKEEFLNYYKFKILE